jgi:hypothetical protein
VTRIQPVVEGHGDLSAVPELIRRVAHANSRYDVQVLPAQKRGDLPTIKPRLERFLRVALQEGASVLWVLDYDCDDCTDVTRDLAALSAQAFAISMPQKAEFVFMVKEFESLFLADHETTRAVFPDIPPTTDFPADPESVRGAKEWLSKARPKGLAYKPTTDQAKLTSQLNFDRLRDRSPSFRRFEAAVLKLLS